MSKYIPTITEDDITRILERDFPKGSHAEIREAFDTVQTQEKLRVIAACLKISNKDTGKLLNEINHANGFWREIIGEAEYPKVRKSRNMTEQQISEKQKHQYEQWLQK